MSEEAKIRRNETVLEYSGCGVIIFAVWGIVKLLLEFFTSADGFREYIREEDYSESVYVIVMIILALILLTDLAFRLYIGISAIREGRGVRKGMSYVVVAVLFLLISLSLDAFLLVRYIEERRSIMLTLISSLLINATSYVIQGEMIVASCRLKKLRR